MRTSRFSELQIAIINKSASGPVIGTGRRLAVSDNLLRLAQRAAMRRERSTQIRTAAPGSPTQPALCCRSRGSRSALQHSPDPPFDTWRSILADRIAAADEDKCAAAVPKADGQYELAEFETKTAASDGWRARRRACTRNESPTQI